MNGLSVNSALNPFINIVVLEIKMSLSVGEKVKIISKDSKYFGETGRVVKINTLIVNKPLVSVFLLDNKTAGINSNGIVIFSPSGLESLGNKPNLERFQEPSQSSASTTYKDEIISKINTFLHDVLNDAYQDSECGYYIINNGNGVIMTIDGIQKFSSKEHAKIALEGSSYINTLFSIVPLRITRLG